MTLPASVGAALRSVSCGVLLRSSLSGALLHHMRCVGRLRKRCLTSSLTPLLMRSLRLHPVEGSRMRVRAFPLLFSAAVPRFRSFQNPPPPNNSFKPTPCRGVNSVLCATLHAVATPLRGGLTQALGGRKALEWLTFQHGDFPGFGWGCSSVRLSARCFFGHVRLARSHIVCVALAGFGNGVWRRHVLRC